MRKSLLSLTLLTTLSLTACSTIMNNLPGVYTLDIKQGNVVDQDMINQLRPKMTKRQVLYVMGSPMLVDVFHQKRWDYLYSVQLGGGEREQKRVSLFFDGDILAGVQGDFKPDANAPRVIKETIIDVPERELDMTLWEKTLWLFGDEPTTKKVPSVNETTENSDDDENNIVDLGL